LAQLGECSIQNNDGLTRECPSLQRFLNGVRKHGMNIMQSGFFAWHGTGSDSGIIGICHDGFDPTRRSGQACGPGEYFGQSSGVSHGYSGSNGRMILSFLLDVTETSKHSNFCYVVNNPKDWTHSYCLPLLIVNYGPKKGTTVSLRKETEVPYCLDNIIENSNSSLQQWSAAFRWYWQQDDTSFEPYTDNINEILEEHYTQYQFGLESAQFLTPPIIRYVNDLPQEYIIDYANYIQINAGTKYQRKIMRKKVEKMLNGAEWEFQNENNKWKLFESMIQNEIEQQFKMYLDGIKPGVVHSLQFPGRPETYTLDFIRGEQNNDNTNTKRNIRRIPKQI